MKPSDWDEILTWIEARWPDLTWNSATCAALFTDLADQDASDVWGAAYRMYERTVEYPRPTAFVALVREVATEVRNRERAMLPEPKHDFEVRPWLKSQGYESVWEMVRREHRKAVRHGAYPDHDAGACGLCGGVSTTTDAEKQETSMEAMLQTLKETKHDSQ